MHLTDVRMDREQNTVRESLPLFEGVINSFKTCAGQTWVSTAQILTSEIPTFG